MRSLKPRSKKQEASDDARAKLIFKRLNDEHFICKTSRDIQLEVLFFRGPHRYWVNTDRIVKFVRSARLSLSICMYSFTLCELAREVLVASRRPNMTVRVIVDTAQMKANGAQIKMLVQGGVKVYVDIIDSFMTHDKVVIVDNSKIMQGSMNWTVHGMKSSGKLFIMDDIRAVEPVVEDYGGALATARRVIQANIVNFPDCNECALVEE